MGDPTPTRGTSIQERFYPEFTCFGCGHGNPAGLHLSSYETPDGVLAVFTPGVEHGNGFGFINGGVIATVLDCHTAAVVILEAEREGWKGPDGGLPLYVTAGFDIRYLRPAPMETVQLWAGPVDVTRGEIRVEAELRHGGKPRAAMTATWKAFTPR